MTAVLAGLVTFGCTTLLTIAGVGAAFVLIPVFLALGIEIHTAMATALPLNAVAMSVASVNFVRKSLVVWKVAVPMVAVASALSPLGAWVSQGLDRAVLLWLFVGFPRVRRAYDALLLTQGPRNRERSQNPARGSGPASAAWRVSSAGCSVSVAATSSSRRSSDSASDPKKASASTSFVVIFASLTGFLGHLSLAGMSYPRFRLGGGSTRRRARSWARGS